MSDFVPPFVKDDWIYADNFTGKLRDNSGTAPHITRAPSTPDKNDGALYGVRWWDKYRKATVEDAVRLLARVTEEIRNAEGRQDMLIVALFDLVK